GAVDVGVRHDNDAAVAQFRNVEAGFVFRARRAIFFRLTDAGPNRSDHRLNFVVLQKLIDARLLDVDQLAANRQDRLVTAVASLFGRAARGFGSLMLNTHTKPSRTSSPDMDGSLSLVRLFDRAY